MILEDLVIYETVELGDAYADFHTSCRHKRSVSRRWLLLLEKYPRSRHEYAHGPKAAPELKSDVDFTGCNRNQRHGIVRSDKIALYCSIPMQTS